MTFSRKELDSIIWKHEARLEYLKTRRWKDTCIYNQKSEYDQKNYDREMLWEINIIKQQLVKLFELKDNLDAVSLKYQQYKRLWDPQTEILAQQFQALLDETSIFLKSVLESQKPVNYIPAIKSTGLDKTDLFQKDREFTSVYSSLKK